MEVPISIVFAAIQQDLGFLDPVVVHSSTGSDLVLSMVFSTSLVASPCFTSLMVPTTLVVAAQAYRFQQGGRSDDSLIDVLVASPDPVVSVVPISNVLVVHYSPVDIGSDLSANLSASQASSFSGSETILESSTTLRLFFDVHSTVTNQDVHVIDSLVQTVPTIVGSFSLQRQPFPYAVHGVRNVCSGSSQISSSVACSTQSSGLPASNSQDKLRLITVLFHEQQLTVSFTVKSRLHFYTFVYVSKSAVVRRSLRQSLRDLVSLVSSSWLVVGDFNVVLGAHESLGLHSPARSSCKDFRSVIEDCDLIGVSSQGARLTWARGRYPRTRIERWLDRALVSEEFSVVEDVIPSLVTNVENAFLISIPSTDDIHDAIFAMDPASAPGPDGFPERFELQFQCSSSEEARFQNLMNIMSAFDVYGNISGQLVNWEGSCEETKLIRVAWDSCCKPYSQGGLGLKDLGLLNDSLLNKLTWKFMTSESFYFFVSKGAVSHAASEISSGARISDFIHEGRWVLDDSFRVRYPDHCFRIDRIAISPVVDSLVWVILEISRSVIWSPPAPGWIKVNTDGAVLSSPGAGGCGGVLRNCKAFVKGCFTVSLGHVFAFEVELLAASMAINFAWQNGWHRIWLESDSSYVVQLLFSRSEHVP
ncbi:hypothetical protein Dsin_022201 [Dipteronia sinensis]|uniref:RNase H type-1 domain-containing protein n=1 Tax=Dipteronia sinensis TaxID=43782 RepID=A0AAE0A2J2_9ROSI|nr:hypothetical protein Dsin_022201 [Dipteronia sinensis]